MARNQDRLLKMIFDAKRQMGTFCDDLLGECSASPSGGWRPPTDIYECEDAIVIKVEVSGLLPDQAEVVIEKNLLVIRGAREERSSQCKRAVHQMEIRYGEFERRVLIGIPFDRDAITYKYKDGFLEVVVPKKAPPEPRKVRLQT